MRPHYITAVKRRQKIFDIVLGAAVTVAFALLGAVVFIEWFAGCGETYIDANGTRHAYECVFIGGLVK
jgi:hypothetical protein